jgi:hypothetical protein
MRYRYQYYGEDKIKFYCLALTFVVKNTAVLRIRDPGSGAFLPQGSGIRIRDDFYSGSRISDPGSLPRPKFKILPLKIAKNRKN